jgi:hypothetical protein
VDSNDCTPRTHSGGNRELVRRLHVAEDQLRHELMDPDEREVLRDRVLDLRAALGSLASPKDAS